MLICAISGDVIQGGGQNIINDNAWIVVLGINIPGFFIHIERPVWAYSLSKWATIRTHIGLKAIFTSNKIGLVIAIIFVVAIIFTDEIPFGLFYGMFFLVFILSITLLSLFKLINASLPPQKKGYDIVEVLDTAIFRQSGDGTTSEFVLMKVLIPGLGVRILPPYPYLAGMNLHHGSRISIFYRKGCFGRIYRFSFDVCF